MNHGSKIPVTLLTGFLGSGKTSFLNRLIRVQEFKNSLVFVNEFGAISVDHLLVEASTETIFELSNGCVCCSIRNDLIETLLTLKFDEFDRIFIETTGIADPLPIFQALTSQASLVEKLMPTGIFTVVDSVRGIELIEKHPEARRQIAVADRILISKTDLEPDYSKLADRLAEMNPTARFGKTTDQFGPNDLLYNVTPKVAAARTTRHHSQYRSMVLETDRPLDPQDFYSMLKLMVDRLGSHLLRIKGFATLEGSEKPQIVQVSGSIIHDPAPASNQAPKLTQLVIITDGTDPKPAMEIFNGFTGTPSLEAADRDALLENPLSIPGGGL